MQLQPAEAQAVRLSPWASALGSLAIGLLVLVLGYFPTLQSMVEVWQRSETFTHGYLIFPISLWLIWRRRLELQQQIPSPDWRGVLVLAGLGLGWLLAKLTDVLVVEQLSFVAMISALTYALMGWQITKSLAFPLGFLLFAVPMGEFLIPPLMNFTADFTVAMLKLSGIPVYREGTFFSIPSGDWSVVEGCSGLRYLIASITLGCLYAYLSYRRLARRLAFIALASGFPVIANGLRAYMIVMIAHLSDMKLALGIDHYIYGWVFFGIVMVFLFWIGSFWQETEVLPSGQPPESTPTCRIQGSVPTYRMALAAVLVLAIWPAYAAYLREEASFAPVALELPLKAGSWRKIQSELTDWKPHYLFPDASFAANYTDGKRQVKLYVLYYRTQAQGKELVNSQNVLIPQKHPVWQMPWEKTQKVALGERNLKLKEGLLASESQRLLVWRLNWVAKTFTASDYLAKLLEAKDKLLGKPQDAAGIVIATACEEDLQPARATLQDFTAAMLPELKLVLEHTGRERYR
jgi:exosortase A